uniref:Putative radical SAM domain protein. Putative Fe-S oxidoreductases n=1 Tax=Magnetococcus massalia (strain MO-1) TaxID=451514 RepID=A0A1S7LGD6_MAGMO|nr:Putative radical SAM domain protein. Putative Fe-S oxidoreductases [Candidatus Magnetococcus massalia]
MEAKAPIKIGGGKLAQHQARVEAWLRGENPAPLTIEVSPVGGCNHNCRHCGPQLFNPYDPAKTFMDRQLFIQFLNDFHAMGGQEIYFAGNGEPLLHPQFDQFMAHGHQLGLDMTFSSNAIPLVEKRYSRILPNTTWARFSVNGGDAETYQLIHQGAAGDFDRMLGNLAGAVSYRNAHKLPTRLAMQMVVYDENWRSLPGLVEQFQKLGMDRLIIRNRINKNGQKNPTEPALFPLLEAAAEDSRIEVRWKSFPREGEPLDLPPANWHRCYGIQFRSNMDHLGNFNPCFRHWYKPSDFGNLHDARFPEIWNSPGKKQLFTEIYRAEDISDCAKWCQVSFDNLYLQEALDGREPKG